MVARKKRVVPPAGVVGDTGAQVSGGISIDEFLPELDFPSGLEVYRKMRRNDPVIGGLVRHLESVFRRIKWGIEAPHNGKKAQRAKALLEEDISGLKYGFSQIVHEMASAFTYGFYVGEKRFSVDGFRVRWKDLEPRHQLTIDSIDLDEGTVGQTSVTKTYTIPVSRCVIHSVDAEARNPFGVSLLRPLYKPYYYKVAIEAAEGVSVDRDLGGLPVMLAPQGFDFTAADSGSTNYDPLVENTLKWAIKLVTNIRKDKQKGVVIPYGWEFKLLRSEGTSSFDTDKVIRRLNTEMAVSLLEGFVAAGGFSSTNQANVSDMIQLFLLACDSMAMGIADTLNRQLVTRLLEYNNFQAYDIPRFEPRPSKVVDLAKLASFVGRLVKNEVITPTTGMERALLEVADLPYDEEEADNA